MAPGSSWRVISYFSLLWLSRCHEDALVDETAWWARPPRDCDSDVYLSVVMVGRNDNYGGTFQSRLATSLRINLHLLNKHASGASGFAAEVIFVEWNPLPSGPSSAALLAEYAAAAAPDAARSIASHPISIVRGLSLWCRALCEITSLITAARRGRPPPTLPSKQRLGHAWAWVLSPERPPRV